MCNSESPSPFVLKNSSEHFLQRQKNVFDQLNSLESNLHKNVAEDMETDEVPVAKKSRQLITKQYRGKESIFKRPEDPIRRNYMKNIPDYKKNPHKWKKYSLADVKDEDMSETCNTKTALSFLNELRSRNQEEPTEGLCDGPKKIIFKKKSDISDNVKNDLKEKPSFRSSKLVMPEYEVGQRVVKEKKQRKINKTCNSQLKLDHLLDVIDD